MTAYSEGRVSRDHLHNDNSVCFLLIDMLCCLNLPVPLRVQLPMNGQAPLSRSAPGSRHSSSNSIAHERIHGPGNDYRAAMVYS